MNNGTILWVDDEMDMLKPYTIFLEKKGYSVMTVSNGSDAIERCQKQTFDLIILDEMMPGLTGLETLQRVKDIQPQTPVVMVTKSEEENIMEQAIGSKIADYLIKPVNPAQILLTLKKNIHRKEIVTEVTQTGYQQEYQQIAMQIDQCDSHAGWMDIYKRIVRWEIELSAAKSGMAEMLRMQKADADVGFAKYIKKHYIDWVKPSLPVARHKQADRPLMSQDVFRERVFPALDNGEKVFFILIDNFRWDQWRLLAMDLGGQFDMEEDMYMSLLPTATQYARNAIFSGLMPSDIAKMFPNLWVDEDSEEGKNLNEAPLIQTQIDRYRRHYKFSYSKINDSAAAEKFLQQYNSLATNDLNVVVINFVDMLSHSRTESRMIRELANDESAYRSITLSWMRHSVIADLFQRLAESDYKVIVTTDHGSIRCFTPTKIIGDRNTNTNLRYKLGKNLSYSAKDVFAINDPRMARLPSPNVSTSYVFATGHNFFAYPNNYNYYVSYYKDTFQHGGISMEEMLIPLVTLRPRRR